MNPRLPSVLLLVLAGCDLGLDPSMIGGAGGAASAATSSTETGGGDRPTTASTTSMQGAGGGGGEGGQAATTSSTGAGGSGTWVPCAAPDDFDEFVVSSTTDAWLPTGNVSTSGAGDEAVRMAAGTPPPELQQTAPTLLDGCFLSAVLEENGGARQYLSIECGDARMEFGVDDGSMLATVEIVNPPTPLSEPADVALEGDLKESILRVRFSGFPEDVVVELRNKQSPDFTPLFAFPQPFWASSCVVGFGADSIGTAATFDDFCAAPP